MKRKIFKIAAVALIAGMSACGEKVDKNVTETETTDFSIQEGCGWKYMFSMCASCSDDAFLVINSQEELAQSYFCEPHDVQSVDFNRYTMLVYICTYEIKATGKLQQENKNEYKWNVNITKAPDGNTWGSFAVLTSKLPQNAKADINISYNQN